MNGSAETTRWVLSGPESSRTAAESNGRVTFCCKDGPLTFTGGGVCARNASEARSDETPEEPDCPGIVLDCSDSALCREIVVNKESDRLPPLPSEVAEVC